MSVNILRPRQNICHLADDKFRCIFLNENVWISIKISLKFVPDGLMNNIPALVQIMAWCRSGNKPLFEPMMVCLPTHICVTLPEPMLTQFTDAYIRHWGREVNIWILWDFVQCEVRFDNFWWQQIEDLHYSCWKISSNLPCLWSMLPVNAILWSSDGGISLFRVGKKYEWVSAK